jgi:glycosyltransferase involved in cell wall biosynthesis
VVTLPFNLGIGTAVQTGYLIAQDSRYDVAIQVDGDGQHPPSEIPSLVAALQSGDADLIIGSRFLVPGRFRSTRGRRLGIVVLARLVSLAVRQRVTDSTSGFRAAGPRAISLFAAAYPHDYPEVESVVVAHRAGLRIAEIPIQMHERKSGRSSITPLRAGYYMIKVSMAIGMVLLRKPAQLPEAPR